MTCADAKSFLKAFIPLIKDKNVDRNVVIAPPFTAISTFSSYSDANSLSIASQNIHWEDSGAFTAEISPRMLLEHNVEYAIVGHSEPRKYFSESDEQINKRAISAQNNGLIPIVCVGEIPFGNVIVISTSSAVLSSIFLIFIFPLSFALIIESIKVVVVVE